MLELLSLLQARQHWNGQDLADKLEVGNRTLRRDIERLRGLGYPVQSTRGSDGGYRLGPGGRLPPLLITDREAVAITLGLCIAASQPIGGINEATISCLVKVTQLLSPQRKKQVEAINETVSTPTNTFASFKLETLTTLARASRDNLRLRFNYCSAQDIASERYVEPQVIVPLERRWYMIAWDLDREDWRTFRLDRIEKPESTSHKCTARKLPASDPVSFIKRSINSAPSTYDVKLVVKAPLEKVQAELGAWGTATAHEKDTTHIGMEVDDLSWPVMLLAALNVDIEYVEPPELKNLLNQLATRFRNSDNSSTK